MPRIKASERVGHKFGKLTVLQLCGANGKGLNEFLFLCECGTQKVMTGERVFFGHTKSCGCIMKGYKGTKRTYHGLTGTKIYRTWRNMISRCDRPNRKDYANYGGRGIKVCERWYVLEHFLQDMGEPEEGFSIDRIDVNGNYCPENCRWATNKFQVRNRRTTLMLSYNGIDMALADWAEKVNLPYTTLFSRYKRGWPVHRILTEPYHAEKQKGEAA